jgi:hypothetical protein
MKKIIILGAAMALLPLVANAQPAGSTNTDTSRLGQPINPSTAPSGNTNSSSSQNTPSSGEPAGRNNPSINRAPDNAQSRGTAQQSQQ